MKIRTTRFGELDIDEAGTLNFPEGVIGFSTLKKYILLDHDANSPFKWLQSLERPALAFVVMDPYIIIPDYSVRLQDEDCDVLELPSADKAALVCIVNISRQDKSVTINLLSPIVVNTEKMLAKQIILTDGRYGIKHPIAVPGRKQCAQSAGE